MSNLDRLGTAKQLGDKFQLRFERLYPHPIAAVWNALTDPKRLEDWMGTAVVEPRVGGRFELMLNANHPSKGRVTVWDPPNVLEFGWSNDDAPDAVARYELRGEGSGTCMIFTHTGVPSASRVLMMPGWHLLFQLLATTLDGGEKPSASRRTWPGYRELQLLYISNYSLIDPTNESNRAPQELDSE